MTDTPANPGPDFALDHVVLYAADPAVSSAFYDALLGWLGFDKRREHVWARDGLFIDLRPADGGRPRGRRDAGVDHFGFRASTRGQVAALRRAMEDAGQEPGRTIEFDNGDYALFLSDPDGTRFELTCYADPAADPVD